MNPLQNQVLQEFCDRATHYSIDISKYKIVETLENSITNDLNSYQLNEFIANTCASFIAREPDFSNLAVEYELKNIYDSTGHDFATCVQKQFDFNLVSEKYYNFVMRNNSYLSEMLVHSRDNLIDFFGLKTLTRSYLLKDKNKKIIETPQMMFARCAIQIHGLYDKTDPEYLFELITQTYNLMSQLYFTHATPTLFNSGGKYPQLSSCYLLQCSDDLEGISKTISDVMKISKWAGGIGVNLSDVRADGALIKSNGGSSNGIIPLCKVLESVARYINQCFAKDTIVYSKRGAVTVENIRVNDKLITKDGSFQKVIGISTKNVNKELYKIRVNHSFESTNVTGEHQIYAIINQAKILNFSVIKNRLNKKITEPIYVSASDLKEGDFIGFPIPTLIEDLPQDTDFFRFYGIMLGDGHACKRERNNIEMGITLGTETKQDVYNFVTNYLTSKNVHYWTSRQDEKKTIYVRWSQNKEKLPITFDDIYDDDRNKIIKNEYMHLPKNKTLALIKGLMETDGHCDKEIYFNTSSRPLAFSLRYLFLRLGILTSGHIRPSGESHEIRPGEIITTKKDGYVLRIPKHSELEPIYGDRVEYSTRIKFFEYNGILWSRIRSIEKEHYNGVVYDFNMENNHNYMTDMGLVHNSGKRAGSVACYLEPWHSDIYEFIELRKNTGDENLRARDLFLALWIPNAFMRAVESDGPWYLMTPDVCIGLTEAYGTKFDELYYSYVQQGKYVKEIKARELFVKIIESQIETGMPYMLYKDHANEKSNQKNLGTIKCSNLCVAPETKILTDKGYLEISTLKNKNVNVWNGEKFSNVKIIQTGKNKKLIRIKFSNQEYLDCTPYHKFYIYKTKCKTEVIEASKLEAGMKLIKFDLPTINSDEEIVSPYTAGLFTADGTYDNAGFEEKRCKYKSHYKKLCQRHMSLLDHETEENCCLDKDDGICIAKSYLKKPRIVLYGVKKELVQYLDIRDDVVITKGEIRDTVRLNADLPEKYYVPINCSINTKLKWFAGLCDGDGCISVNDGNKSIQISSIHLDFLKNVRLMLTTLGVNPKISMMHEKANRLMPDGKGGEKLFECQTCYRLLLTSNHLYKLNELGFKTNRLDNTCPKPQRDASTFITVESIEDLGRKDNTYCFNEPEKHMGIFNGILTGNCSEIIEYSSANEIAVCNLASICLPMFVENGMYNFEKLGQIVQVAVHNLNNIIDMNFYPVPETAKSNFSHRPIGLGVQGLADTYIKLGYPFDSPQASKLNRQIFECIYFNALTKSNELAKNYGPYKTFEGSPFSQGLLQFHLAGKTVDDMDKELGYDWVNLIESIKEFGTRNSLLTTVMPTASTAQIMNNTESIEPVTTNIYVRKVLAGEYIVINKYLVQDLKKLDLWNEQIYSELIFDNGSVQKLDIPEDIKNKYKTAYDIKQKVIVDQSVDRSIFIDQSQSLNLFWEKPDISKVYASHIYGWKKGLKTGMYYLKSRPSTEAIKFGIDVEIEKNIKQKRGIDTNTNTNNGIGKNNQTQSQSNQKTKYKDNSDEVCLTCSA
jgi:ribonucleoside-diphosphate reductase alpha chain